MIDTIKTIYMEVDSLTYIKEQKKTGEYERLKELDKENYQNKKMEVMKLKSVYLYIIV